MIEQGLFKRYFVGRDGFIWWIGQIAPESTWKDNKPAGPVGSNGDMQGFGERYRVRIMGYHTADVDSLPDEELPWAYIMYPVTAGTGSRGSSASANITQGDFVFGFFMDGEDAQMPVIMGLLGNNEYAAVQKNITPARFIPFSGFTESDQLPRYSIKTNQGDEVVEQTGAQTTDGNTQAQGDKAETPNNTVADESATQSTTTIDAASTAAAEEQTQPLAQPSDCEPIPMGKIQQDIQNAISEIQKLQKSITSYELVVTIAGREYDISDIEGLIQKKMQWVTKKVSEGIKWVMKQSQKFVTRTVNEIMNKTYSLLFPSDRPALHVAIQTVNDLIACLFRKFIGSLVTDVGEMMEKVASNVINAASCVVENMVANTLGQIVGEISSAVNGVLGGITALTGQVTAIAGQILGIITDLLSFLSCEETPNCSEVNNWNILSGAAPISKSNLDSLISKASSVASTAAGIGDAASGAGQGLDFSDVLELDSCNLGPILCGPPLLDLWGSGGSGAAANLVIGNLGEVIGVDLISFGAGYDSAYANVNDPCGNGSGAVLKPVIGNYFIDSTDDQGNVILDSQGNPIQEEIQNGIIDIVIIEPGAGYLAAPDGSKGAGGYTWADPEDTTVKHPDGSYDTPKPPGIPITVNPGDEVETPPGTIIITEPQPGGTDDVIIGVDGEEILVEDQIEDQIGQGGGEEILGGIPIIIKNPGVFTSPKPDFERITGQYPVVSSGSYPVILYLCDVVILETGFNYSEGDQVIIEPDIGAKAEAKFDAQGRVISVKVTEGAEGFTEFPRLYIRSNSGYNAVLRPRLCIDRVGSDKLKEPMVQDKIVSVIDCVGKI